MKLQRKDWERLAAWRGAAALFVAFGHMVQVFIYPTSVWLAPYSGLMAQASVMMFFVISGCSIAASAHSLIEHKKPVRTYVWNRMTRLWPPLIFAICLMWFLSVLAPYLFASNSLDYFPAPRLAREGYYFDWQSALSSLVFVNGFFAPTSLVNGPLWSLSYEFWLYIVFPLFIFGRARKQRSLVVISVVLFFIVAYADQSGGRLLFLKYALIWAAGTFVFDLLATDSVHLLRGRGGFLMCIAAVATSYYGWNFVRSNMNADVTPFNLMFGLYFACFLVVCQAPIDSFYKIMMPISEFGYTLYLIHFPVYLFIFGIFQIKVGQNPWLALMVGMLSLALCLVLAAWAAKFLERRVLFLKLLGRYL